MSKKANYRPYRRHDRSELSMTRSGAIHDHNEAGSKLERRFAKAILRKAKDPATSAKVGCDRARVVRAKYHTSITGV